MLVFEQFNSTRFLDEITMFDKHIEHDQIVMIVVHDESYMVENYFRQFDEFRD